MGATSARIDSSAYRRLFKYGLTNAEWLALIEKQQGLCAICGKAPLGKGAAGKLQVDHCHATGRIRGLLCHHCNVALSKVENHEWHERALQYLK
jgi:hypothetical protein